MMGVAGEVVAAGLDTDCNGATVGGLWGLRGDPIPRAWTDPWRGRVAVTLAGVVILAFEPGMPAAPDARSLALLLATGVTGVTAYSALTRAMRTGEVSVVAPFRYSRLLFALILAYIIFGERPDALMFAGAALIVGSGLYTLWRSGQVGSPALSPAPSHKEPRP